MQATNAFYQRPLTDQKQEVVLRHSNGSDDGSTHRPWTIAHDHSAPTFRLDTARTCHHGVCWDQHGLGAAKVLGEPGRRRGFGLAPGSSCVVFLLEEENQEVTIYAHDLRSGTKARKYDELSIRFVSAGLCILLGEQKKVPTHAAPPLPP